ncbi:hypothetical protein LTR47_010474 [Exophiala xenobiotica]|nr:hypothetical protein LTR47_010474 [Exophiala xenobiotica]KAK5243974.1 hypothetical protein LTS06_010368 [Exophiala xenobiotica]KAK5358308.1 hypothetical protein LTR11_010979 [Exophiala xenobiotica]KAK5544795.1 hypothetical protein LTR23_004235 [Chaetothyriales sp. CCFEE 6169]
MPFPRHWRKSRFPALQRRANDKVKIKWWGLICGFVKLLVQAGDSGPVTTPVFTVGPQTGRTGLYLSFNFLGPVQARKTTICIYTEFDLFTGATPLRTQMSTTLESMFNAADITTPGYYGPSETALLLLDFHTMFVKQAGGDKAPAALEVAAQLRTWAKEQGIQVIHALIDVNMTPFPTCKGSKGFASIAAAMQSTGTDVEPPELLSESSNGEDNDVTFTRKPGYVSALKSPGMEEFLQKRGIKSLVLTGLSTSGCVARTVFAASDAEYVVTVISDGCADRDADVHEMMVQRLLNNRAYVATAADFQKGFTEASSEKK